ncbi:MAG: ABC transporter permease [Muribaculum sp.]|nr:ABC transporter permease [Muribaculum sp.]
MKAIPMLIAMRFLAGKKSHRAVNAIAFVSVAGVAVATAAVICVLSVFNGFQSILSGRLDTLAPDLMVTPAEGKTIAHGDSLANMIAGIKEVEIATPTLTDNALGFFNGRETPVTLKGIIPKEYSLVTSLDSLMIAGGNTLQNSDAENPALISVGTAYKLSLFNEGEVFNVFAPKRLGRFNPANPAAAFVMDSLYVADIFQSLQEEYDENTIFTDISIVRDLLLYDNEATAIEIKLKAGANQEDATEHVSKLIGPEYLVKDRLMQQEINFRMIQIEKWMTFLLLFFILVIASFNIISTISMLVLEKTNSMRTMSAIGLSRSGISRVFMWESVLVSAIGALAGIALGSILCLLQQHYGFITIANGGIEAEPIPYPVCLEASDILITLIPIILITLLCALVASTFAKSRLNT